MAEEMPRAPRAYRWDLWFCGQCPNAHVIFYDENNVVQLEATMSAAQADRIAKAVRDNDPNFKTPTGGRDVDDGI